MVCQHGRFKKLTIYGLRNTGLLYAVFDSLYDMSATQSGGDAQFLCASHVKFLHMREATPTQTVFCIKDLTFGL